MTFVADASPLCLRCSFLGVRAGTLGSFFYSEAAFFWAPFELEICMGGGDGWRVFFPLGELKC